jgi:hypothetical protein
VAAHRRRSMVEQSVATSPKVRFSRLTSEVAGTEALQAPQQLAGKILGWDTGFTWYTMNDKEHEEVSMSYKVKFSPGFDWTKGGKLPGLCGGGVFLTTKSTRDTTRACPATLIATVRSELAVKPKLIVATARCVLYGILVCISSLCLE